MKKEEYLHKALLLVSNPYTKAQVQRELEDHIEDETSFYTDAGYEREKAENMAMSRMGAPEEMARELGPPAPEFARSDAGFFRPGGVRGTICAVWV